MHLHEILAEIFSRFDQNETTRIIETGTIRGDNEPSRIGDGWSTLWFAQRPWISLTSIDLDTSVAEHVLDRYRGTLVYLGEQTQNSLRYAVNFIQGYSVDILAGLLASRGAKSYDAIFLDSDNDAQLIFHEFLIAQRLAKKLVIIDDVCTGNGQDPIAHKGDQVLPYIQGRNKYKVYEREGWNNYRTSVIAIEV
jgi:hypothetical protein